MPALAAEIARSQSVPRELVVEGFARDIEQPLGFEDVPARAAHRDRAGGALGALFDISRQAAPSHNAAAAARKLATVAQTTGVAAFHPSCMISAISDRIAVAITANSSSALDAVIIVS